jgi:hypothetical protein
VVARGGKTVILIRANWREPTRFGINTPVARRESGRASSNPANHQMLDEVALDSRAFESKQGDAVVAHQVLMYDLVCIRR